MTYNIAMKNGFAMPLKLITIPCLSDNYAFLLGNPDTMEAAVIDVPEAGPINAAVAKGGWRLTTVLLTHHHDDHIMGLDGLTGHDGLTVIGAKADAHRLPPLTHPVAEGDVIDVLGQPTQIMDVSGHTVGHIAFYMEGEKIVFTADSLMALGCGRLFEGTPAQMWDSLLKLRALPDDVTVCSGHEYTASNANFAITIDPGNAALTSRITAITAARSAGVPTVPSELGLEKRTNPFLRADDLGIRAHLDMTDASDADVFTEIRARKDRF